MYTNELRRCLVRSARIQSTFFVFDLSRTSECVVDRIVLNAEGDKNSNEERLDLATPFPFLRQRLSVL